MKPITKVLIHYVSVVLMDKIEEKIHFPLFCLGPPLDPS